jgi:hypothetical protein
MKFKTLALLMVISLGAASHANAHSWYSVKRDPVTTKGCCGNSDCHEVKLSPENYAPEADGFRVRLTVEQARTINPNRVDPLDIFVPFDRVQPSEDGNFHLCIPTRNGLTQGDFYCFFAPGLF